VNLGGFSPLCLWRFIFGVIKFQRIVRYEAQLMLNFMFPLYLGYLDSSKIVDEIDFVASKVHV